MRQFSKIINFIVIFLFVFIFSVNVSAKLFDPELEKAVDAIYNARFFTANKIITTHLEAHPKDPYAYLLRGMMQEWDQVINNKRKRLNPLIYKDYEKANDYAYKLWEKDKNNIEKKVLLGNTYMYLAKKMLDKGQKFKAGLTLKKSKNLMLEVIKKDPNNYDAYMALGTFNYFSNNVPSGLKWLASLLGFNGSKEQGIAYLKKAASNNNITRGDAGFLLVYIFGQKEKKWMEAVKYNNMMRKRFPRNPSFQYEMGELHFRAKEVAKARSYFDQFFTFCGVGSKKCNNKYKFLAHYFMTWSYMDEKNYGLAKKHLDMAMKLNDKQYKDRNVDLDLWAGILAKDAGDKELAKNYFKKVEENQNKNMKAWNKAQKELEKL